MKMLQKADEPYINNAYEEKAVEVRTQVAEYMRTATVVLSSPSLPSPTTFHCDGQWIWTADAANAVADGTVEPQQDFVEHVLKVATPPDALTPEQSDEAIKFLSR